MQTLNRWPYLRIN